MLNTIDISIIIVNYNVKDFLHKCLDSIYKSQTKLKLEVIVVDNHSQDNSIEFLTPLFPQTNFITLDSNLGFGKANNIGLNSAKGKYILFLNPDTLLSQDTLQKQFEFMESNSNIAISGCKVLNDDHSFQLACRRGFPTPWNSFCKLFGLQDTFPNVKFFAGYNLTYKSTDETYPVDSVIGAFMFCRASVIKELNGFDEDFFMYGEDIDLCLRAKKLGFENFYFHETTIIHYKGESTKRSQIDELKHFYEAMKIYVHKHHSESATFLLFLKLGIELRNYLSLIQLHFATFIFIILDIISINLCLLLATKINKGNYFHFPDYAYPLVFYVISIVNFLSFFFVGEYFEDSPKVNKSSIGLLGSFFILTILTYFFKDYAFGRGILLLTIGIALLVFASTRLIYSFILGKKQNKEKYKVAIVGINSNSIKLGKQILDLNKNIELLGFFNVDSHNIDDSNISILGGLENFKNIVQFYKPNEIIIADSNLKQIDLLKLLSEQNARHTKFHIANNYEELVTSRMINKLTSEETKFKYKITIPRIQVGKRIIDIVFSFILLTVGLPFLPLINKGKMFTIHKLFKVFIGKLSIVGLSSLENTNYDFGKYGILSLAGMSKVDGIEFNNENISKVNEYYLNNYSLGLDLRIIFQYLFHKQ